ncbi:MAG: hypothetical protein HZA53_10955 [Planctomycetes bacterium]|nr:hypothetical protein [Planctomycetota bacterium]
MKQRSAWERAAARAALASVLALAAACGRGDLVPDAAGGAALMRTLLLAPAVDGSAPPGPAVERCARIAAVAAQPGAPRLTVLASGAASPREHARVVIGTAADPDAARLARALGVELTRAGAFRYLGQEFDRPADLLVATWRDPDRPALPVTLVFGNDAAQLALDLEAPLAAWKPNVRILRAGDSVLEAPLELDGRCVRERLVRPQIARAALRSRYVPVPENLAAFWGRRAPEVDAARVLAWCSAAAGAAAHAATWASPGVDARPCELVVHAELEDFERWTGVRAPARWNAHTKTAHVLLEDGLEDDGGAVIARATLDDRLGPCSAAWLVEGAVVHAAQRWHGRALTEWTGHLARAEATLSVDVLIDPGAARRHSPHVVAPLRAEIFGLLLETRGTAFARELWKGSARITVTPELEAAFAARLAVRAAALVPVDAARAAERRTARGLCGLVLAPPPFERRDGYGTRSADTQLARAEELGAGMVAVTSSFAAEDDPPGRALAPAPRVLGALGGDLALFATLGRAREHGAKTALLPQLLSAPGGTWAGSWLRNGETDWRAFFAQYRRFATHYALVAELAGCDTLSLGGGLLETTRHTVEGRRGEAEELVWKDAGWASVIRAARGAFTGRLTFLAGSAEEVEKIAFWDALDLVGLEPRVLNRPLRGAEERDARAAFQAMLQTTWKSADRVAREHRRPLFVASVSFPATGGTGDARIGPGAWSETSRTEAFARCVALASESKDVLDAVLLGRWSTARGDRGLGPRDHVLDEARAGATLEALLRAGFGAQR